MSDETVRESAAIVPITIADDILRGIGLTQGDPAEFEDSDEISQTDSAASKFRVLNFHSDKIMVSVYETEAGRVRIEGLPYDEYIHVLEGRLILTPDADGKAYEFAKGDSLVIPRGFVGEWYMPEKYRELIVINADYEE